MKAGRSMGRTKISFIFKGGGDVSIRLSPSTSQN